MASARVTQVSGNMIESLLRESRSWLAEGLAREVEGAEHLGAIIGAIVEAIDRGDPAGAPTPRLLPPVERHLDAAVALADRGPAARLAAALKTSAPLLAWHDSAEDYAAYPEMAAFTRRFGFASVMGPAFHGLDSPLSSDKVFFGFSLQAPGTLYPAHGHRAVEIYTVLGGTAAWWRAGDGWRRQPPGSFILHEPDRAHAMETFEEPLLTLFAWVGDLDCELWVGEAPPGAG